MKTSHLKKKVLTSQIILSTLRKNRIAVQKYKVKKLGLFGSFASGFPHAKSDLDFLVQFKEPTFNNYMELKFLLEKLFHRKVDLVMEENLKPALQYVKKEVHYVSLT